MADYDDETEESSRSTGVLLAVAAGAITLLGGVICGGYWALTASLQNAADEAGIVILTDEQKATLAKAEYDAAVKRRRAAARSATDEIPFLSKDEADLALLMHNLTTSDSLVSVPDAWQSRCPELVELAGLPEDEFAAKRRETRLPEARRACAEALSSEMTSRMPGTRRVNVPIVEVHPYDFHQQAFPVVVDVPHGLVGPSECGQGVAGILDFTDTLPLSFSSGSSSDGPAMLMIRVPEASGPEWKQRLGNGEQLRLEILMTAERWDESQAECWRNGLPLGKAKAVVGEGLAFRAYDDTSVIVDWTAIKPVPVERR